MKDSKEEIQSLLLFMLTEVNFSHSHVTLVTLITPCSSPTQDGCFSTHITPQEECSYVSFETNVKVASQ